MVAPHGRRRRRAVRVRRLRPLRGPHPVCIHGRRRRPTTDHLAKGDGFSDFIPLATTSSDSDEMHASIVIEQLGSGMGAAFYLYAADAEGEDDGLPKRPR